MLVRFFEFVFETVHMVRYILTLRAETEPQNLIDCQSLLCFIFKLKWLQYYILCAQKHFWLLSNVIEYIFEGHLLELGLTLFQDVQTHLEYGFPAAD